MIDEGQKSDECCTTPMREGEGGGGRRTEDGGGEEVLHAHETQLRKTKDSHLFPVFNIYHDNITVTQQREGVTVKLHMSN